MRSLNIEELNEVQGGGISFKWAYKLGEAIANMYTLYDAAQKIEFEPSSYGAVDASGYNAMGDYSGMCTR
ncbi:MAG: hypothetical protein RLZZ152_60 [Pseudomonadota bacterium]|jgi:hypothetical protein